ncbi:hypothetical protein [Nannocystis pusilla]|uniref:Uncharacterized protein n=1 Tax=Nannocystis pusilla TaxID=889268 RepID=A0ABS7TX50_9BACT|nr:hypothetical protein [Nannocystis pusilla]MBZ5712838.1 hypothetical protein [Nannocystis pusilla]
MSLLSPGAVLRYEMADDDAADNYEFQILETDDQLVLSSAFEDGEPEAVVAFSNDSLADSRTIAVLSQGSWLSGALEEPTQDDECDRLDADLPPFLLSRTMLFELRAGGTRLRSEWAAPGSEPLPLKLTERATAELEIDGEPQELAVLVASGDGIEVTVVDDEAWPLVVERVEGDNYWRLLAIDHGELGEGENEDDDEDLPPPEPAGPLAATGQISGDAFVALARRLGVAGMDMDYQGSRFSLLDAERKIVISADYKIVLVAMPGGVLRRAHVFDRYIPDQVLGPLEGDDPVDLPGSLKDGLAIAEKLAERAGADVLYPDALGPMYIALFNVRALAD